jgi:S1-C subfamily serine protease
MKQSKKLLIRADMRQWLMAHLFLHTFLSFLVWSCIHARAQDRDVNVRIVPGTKWAISMTVSKEQHYVSCQLTAKTNGAEFRVAISSKGSLVILLRDRYQENAIRDTLGWRDNQSYRAELFIDNRSPIPSQAERIWEHTLLIPLSDIDPNIVFSAKRIAIMVGEISMRGYDVDGLSLARAPLNECYRSYGGGKPTSQEKEGIAALGSSPPAVAPNEPQPTPRPQAEESSSGTGFFVSFSGYVVTNRHVVDGCRTASVSRPGFPTTDARIVGADATNDLALLTTGMGTKMVPPFRMGARVGESIFVYGFPLTGILSSSGNFTVGTITSVAGLGDDSRILQISAPVQLGNSGGPLLDKFGNVVGIIVSKLNALRLAQLTQDVAQNINFAIKASIAANFLEVNNIQTQVSSIAQPLEPTEIAERAQQFTVQVTCKAAK